MTTYLETYCTISDIQLVAPFVFDYDRKRTISNWASYSGSGNSTIYQAGSVGKFSVLFENDIEQTEVQMANGILTKMLMLCIFAHQVQIIQTTM